MASIRIHEDQENQRSDMHRSKLHAVGNGGNQKRAVLGTLDSNRHENNVQKLKGKQPPGQSKLISPNNCQNKENWGQSNKEITRKNIVNPIIPVAQFEAFKVYEDVSVDDKYAKNQEKTKSKSTTVAHNKGIENGFSRPDSPCPMSIEKDTENEYNEEIMRRAVKPQDDFFTMSEYSIDIYKYLRKHEHRNRAKPGYMKKQPDVTASMRTILVDWLVEVAEEYKLHTETLYLAVNYIDRFLSYMSVVRAKLQLVGTSAMFLASKYEEIYPPDIGEFVYITDDTYAKRQVIRMEQLIAKVLQFDLSVPTPLAFITSMCTINKIDEKTKFLAMYLCELSLLEGETYLEFLPSQLAASGIAIARYTLGNQMWPAEFSKNTGYELSHLCPCIEFLYKMFVSAPTNPQHAIQDKYKSQKYLHVSQTTPKELLPIQAYVKSDIKMESCL